MSRICSAALVLGLLGCGDGLAEDPLYEPMTPPPTAGPPATSGGEGPAAPVDESARWEVHVDGAGIILVDGHPTELAALRERLATTVPGEVRVTSDERDEMEKTLEVVDVLRSAGVQHLSLAVGEGPAMADAGPETRCRAAAASQGVDLGAYALSDVSVDGEVSVLRYDGPSGGLVCRITPEGVRVAAN